MNDTQLMLPLPTPDATRQLGRLMGRSLLPDSIVLLDGDLGSGKTTLVQGIGEGLGIADLIVSPTFVLVNEYDDGRIPLYHFDLYRLNAEEADALAIETYWDSREYAPGIVAIEWADRLGDRPSNYLHIILETAQDGTTSQALQQQNAEPDIDLAAEMHYAYFRCVASDQRFQPLWETLKKYKS
ncbi:MAG: tRNA (adenosine(37)-N6)-threonylcarbamoyltransferase complex ATPase subunit type 1 TsaE [Elainellaceae cyanobacterium]